MRSGLNRDASEYGIKRKLSFQELPSSSITNSENRMMYDTNFMWSAPIDYKFNVELDGSMKSMPITLKLRKRKSENVSPQSLKSTSKIARSKTFHGKSDKKEKEESITKFCS